MVVLCSDRGLRSTDCKREWFSYWNSDCSYDCFFVSLFQVPIALLDLGLVLPPVPQIFGFVAVLCDVPKLSTSATLVRESAEQQPMLGHLSGFLSWNDYRGREVMNIVPQDLNAVTRRLGFVGLQCFYF